jgi:hypothetical protein
MALGYWNRRGVLKVNEGVTLRAWLRHSGRTAAPTTTTRIRSRLRYLLGDHIGFQRRHQNLTSESHRAGHRALAILGWVQRRLSGFMARSATTGVESVASGSSCAGCSARYQLRNGQNGTDILETPVEIPYLPGALRAPMVSARIKGAAFLPELSARSLHGSNATSTAIRLLPGVSTFDLVDMTRPTDASVSRRSLARHLRLLCGDQCRGVRGLSLQHRSAPPTT